MPVSYSVDTERQLILTRWKGVVTRSDAAAHWQALFSDKAALAVRRSLADLRGADLQFTGEELIELISEYIRPVADGGPWRTALIVDQPVVFGVSRQFQGYAQIQERSRVFMDESEAVTWLLAQVIAP